MVLSVRPVFVGGPLHGEPVDFTVVELGLDFTALQTPNLEEIVWRYDSRQDAMVNGEVLHATRVTYTPKLFNLVSQDAADGEVTIRNVFQIKVWVDVRLCEEAADRRMWEIIRANRWEHAISGCLGWGMPVNRVSHE